MIALARQRVAFGQMNLQFARTFLTNQQLGIDKFLMFKEKVTTVNKSILINNIKSSLEGDGFVYTEDLKGLAYVTDTPEDAKLLKDAFIKFASNGEPLRLGSFKIGPVISRALYQIDDLDSLKELFNHEKTSQYLNFRSSYNVYLSFLHKKEQYDEVLKVGDEMFEKVLAEPIGDRRVELDNSLIIYLAAANKISSKQVLDRARKLLHNYSNKISESDRSRSSASKLRLKQVMLYHLLCVKNNELSEAMEIISQFRTNHYEFLNARAMILIKLGRLDDCLSTLNKILDDQSDKARYVFSETLDTIKEQLAKNPHEELQTKIDSLSQEKILDAQIEDIVLALPNARATTQSDRQRRSTSFNNGGRFNRDNRSFGDRNQFYNNGNRQFENRFDQNRSGSNFNRFNSRPQFSQNYGNRFEDGNRFNNDSFDGSRRPFRPFQTRFKDNNQESNDII